MIVAVSAQPENITEDPIAGETLDSRTLEQLREQIAYTLAIATQEGTVVTNHEFHLIISQSGGRHDWALFGSDFTDPGSADLFAGDEPTHESAFAAAMQQAILTLAES